MKLIALTQGQDARVDDSTYEWLNRWKWYAKWDKRSRTFYAARQESDGKGGQRTIRMHRIIAGAPDGVKVDHRDRDTLNNTGGNLRLASDAENARNCGTRASHGFKGVSLTESGRWAAQIKVNYKSICLGRFDTPEEAHAAYRAAAGRFHGEFAGL